MTIVDLYPYLILIGGSILAATGMLLQQARRRAHITNQLVMLNESLDFDLPNFLRQCWKPLSQAGFSGIDWRLDWFGTTLFSSEGSQAGGLIHRKFEVEEISLDIKLCESQRRFEQRYFSTVVSESFFLLLHMDLWIKLGTVQGAFAQTAKLAVFLQHDMKNLVQMISLMAEQIETPQQGSELKILHSLQAVMPTLRERAERFLNTLGTQVQRGGKQEIDLAALVINSARILDLPVRLSGEGRAFINEISITSVLDNLLGNYVDQSRINPHQVMELHVDIKDQGQKIELTIQDLKGKPCKWPERLFEPFWSEKGGSSLGIGLYHARQLVQMAGGMLRADSPFDSPLVFILSLPRHP